MIRAILIVAATLAVALPAAADVVTPTAGATRPGTGNGLGFDLGAFAGNSGSQRLQQFYSGSVFGTAPVDIYGIAFRPSSDAQGRAFTATIQSITITLSTSRNARGAESTTFADNVGADAVTVVDGPLTLGSARTPAAHRTTKFDIVIPLATAFAYDPTKGPLLLDVLSRDGTTQTSGFDWFSGGVPEVSQLFTLYFNSGLAPTGFFRANTGFITKFITAPIAPVAEPATALLGLLGLGLLAAARRMRPMV